MDSRNGREPRVYVGRLPDAGATAVLLGQSIEWLVGGRGWLRNARVFVKPNLTWREPMPGVTTTPSFIEAVVVALRQWTGRIIIGESDGGYHSFKAEEAFESHGLYRLVERYGVQVVNLSEGPSECGTVDIAGRSVSVELPRLLLHDVDVFITLPVPKVHVMTRVSLGFKNQWGCQPGTMRLRNHPDFSRKVLAINKLVRPRLAVYDGTYFLDQTGPMIGKPVRMDLLIASDDPGAGDLACCEIMGIDPRRVRHLRLAQHVGLMPRALDEVGLSQPLGPFRTRRFHLHRSPINYVALALFHSHFGTHLFYDSPFAGPIHRVLYAIRRNPLVGRVLYGPMGPPAADGGRP
jgi:uncharacterized protein (DUF362 family)